MAEAPLTTHRREETKNGLRNEKNAGRSGPARKRAIACISRLEGYNQQQNSSDDLMKDNPALLGGSL